MAKSLQEQLMGSGLVDKKKAKSIQKEKRTKRKQTPKGQEQVNEVKERTERQKQEKIAKDRELNKLRQEEAESKAVKAQIRQMIQKNAIAKGEGDIGFQFAVDKKIKKIYINAEHQAHLLQGRLAISTLDEDFLLVPRGVADKIVERDASAIVYLQDKKADDVAVDEEDPYKDFEIPDDLMW